MSNQITPNPSVPSQVVAEVTFPRWINNLGIIPTSYKDSMSYYECLAWLCKFLEDTVIPSVNENGDAVQELQNLYIELNSYVTHYFENLDVQQEINNKLDAMVEDGSLSSIIENYIDPYINAQNQNIENFKTSINLEMQNLTNRVNSATNGSPLVADSIEEMTDTSKIYVLTSDGYWYYYDGTEWQQGAEYQRIVENYDSSLTVNNGVPNSKAVGDRINQSYYKNNVIDPTNYTDNKMYSATGELTDSESYLVFNDIIELNEGDTLYLQKNTSGTITAVDIGILAIVNVYGEFVERLTNVITYTATNHCYVIINAPKTQMTTAADAFAYINIPKTDLQDFKYQDKNNNEINEINYNMDKNSTQYNFLNLDKSINNQNFNAQGRIVYTSNTYFISNIIPVKENDVLRFYNFENDVYSMIQVCKFDEDGHFVERTSVSNNAFSSTFDGYVMFNITKPASVSSLSGKHLDITKNREISTHYDYGKIFNYQVQKNIKVTKVNNNEFLINFDKYNITLFKTVDSGANANNWNLKLLKRNSNVIVPAGTDILGPVRINDNSDFIGGIHGDEITNHIIIVANGTEYKDSAITGISELYTDYLSIILNSNVYDQVAGDIAFERNVNIDIYDNKIHVFNSFIAKKNLTLRTACTGGLIACHNTIINEIIMNNLYLDSPSDVAVNNISKYNTFGIINTIYGTITVNNIKGYQNPNYKGFLHVYSEESPVRSKLYFEPYFNGSYSIQTNDIIDGEFEYIFS